MMSNNYKYTYALFDFDGTVADTKQGIMNGADYSLSHYGIKSSAEELRRFVGPTLWHSFAAYGFDSEKQNEAVEIYREYYSRKGMFEAWLYPGIYEMLSKLKHCGIKLGIASAKNQSTLEASCENLKIDKLFDVILGSNEDGSHSDKAELISCLEEKLQIKRKDKCVFVGDSRTDATGAIEAGVDFISALYDREPSEFEGLKVTYNAYTIEDLRVFLLQPALVKT